MKYEKLKIEGMSCGHCIMAVKKELGKLDNIKIKDVQIGSAEIEFDETKIDSKRIAQAVEDAGYKVVYN